MKKAKFEFVIDDVRREYQVCPEGGEPLEFSTDSEGRGMWIDGKQIKGLVDFSMPESKSQKRRVMKKLYLENNSWLNDDDDWDIGGYWTNAFEEKSPLSAY